MVFNHTINILRTGFLFFCSPHLTKPNKTLQSNFQNLKKKCLVPPKNVFLFKYFKLQIKKILVAQRPQISIKSISVNWTLEQKTEYSSVCKYMTIRGFNFSHSKCFLIYFITCFNNICLQRRKLMNETL